VWTATGSSAGSYIFSGTYRGNYAGSNTGSGTLFIYASGGNNGTAGGQCSNTSKLDGFVAGSHISGNADNSPSYGKVAFITFAVPPGKTFTISSYPTANDPCGEGLFTVWGYQM